MLTGVCMLVAASGGCSGPKAPSDAYNPVVSPANFVSTIDSPFFPLTPGTTFVYESDTPEGVERIEVMVTHETKSILGVTCTVVRDTVTLDGELKEDTLDWYAQDRDGAVWYFGEDSRTYENGVEVSTEGSWEAGVDGALPGVIMQANPQVGAPYRQEYYVGVAEDMAQVISLDQPVTVAFGSFQNCLETKEFTPLEPGVVAYKFYAAGIGHVLSVEGDVREELIAVESE
ncbi:MAG: hypothetical protein V2A79_17630 [Planctomycetota bacterium]